MIVKKVEVIFKKRFFRILKKPIGHVQLGNWTFELVAYLYSELKPSSHIAKSITDVTQCR